MKKIVSCIISIACSLVLAKPMESIERYVLPRLIKSPYKIERPNGLHDGFLEGSRPDHMFARYRNVARRRVKFALVHRKKNRLYARFSAKNCEFCKFCEFCEFLQDDILFIDLLTGDRKECILCYKPRQLNKAPEVKFHYRYSGI